MIDLAAILEQHKRSESLRKRKLYPAIRITGFDVADEDAAALCDAIDAAAMGSRVEETDTEMLPCSRVTSFSRRLDW
jgi:hypothetical protein